MKAVSAEHPTWDSIHSSDESWRRKLVGEINEAFVVPRYVKLFYDTYGDLVGKSFLEVGAGNGDLSVAILAQNHGQIGRYVTSEYFPEGVEWLRSRGLEAVQANAEALPFPDDAFDRVIEFDVMHHVDDPRAMALSMMRVSRGKLLLVESNGLSVIRKLLEFTPGRRAAGERSYTPWTYRGFFEGHSGFVIDSFTIYPFLFPFKVPHLLLPALVGFNKAIEKVPFFRWQCSSVVIVVDYTKQGS